MDWIRRCVPTPVRVHPSEPSRARRLLRRWRKWITGVIVAGIAASITGGIVAGVNAGVSRVKDAALGSPSATPKPTATSKSAAQDERPRAPIDYTLRVNPPDLLQRLTGQSRIQRSPGRWTAVLELTVQGESNKAVVLHGIQPVMVELPGKLDPEEPMRFRVNAGEQSPRLVAEPDEKGRLVDFPVTVSATDPQVLWINSSGPMLGRIIGGLKVRWSSGTQQGELKIPIRYLRTHTVSENHDTSTPSSR